MTDEIIEGFGDRPTGPAAGSDGPTTDLKEVGRALAFIRSIQQSSLPAPLKQRAQKALRMIRASAADIDALISTVNTSGPIPPRERALDILINLVIAGV